MLKIKIELFTSRIVTLCDNFGSGQVITGQETNPANQIITDPECDRIKLSNPGGCRSGWNPDPPD